jgi:hypothetical protein
MKLYIKINQTNSMPEADKLQFLTEIIITAIHSFIKSMENAKAGRRRESIFIVSRKIKSEYDLSINLA